MGSSRSYPTVGNKHHLSQEGAVTNYQYHSLKNVLFMGKLMGIVGEQLSLSDIPIHLADAIERLGTGVGEEWQALSDWATFYIKLGVVLNWHQAEHPYALAIATPSRAYAAALVGFGSVLGAVGKSDARLHLDWLRSLSEGDPIQVLEGGYFCEAKFVEITERGGIPHVAYRVQDHGEHLQPLNDGTKFQPLDKSDLDLGARVKRRAIDEEGAEFFEALDLPIEAAAFQFATTESSLIVTNKILFRQELEETCFVVKVGDHFVEGCLGHVMRVRTFQTVQAVGGYRTEAVSVYGEADERAGEVSVVVFDGAQAYFRYCQVHPRAHHVIILDKTDRSFNDGVEHLKSGYMFRLDDLDLSHLCPPGYLDVLAFSRRG